jgi:predicted transcriptional regulator
MMNVLISIKPKYVAKILSGQKRYEYRKRIFHKKVNRIYIYSSAPQKQIVGFFEYSGYLEGSPEELWERTNNMAGITIEEYKKYFDNNLIAYALKIEKIIIYNIPIDPYSKDKSFRPPQSFKYIEMDIDDENNRSLV